MALLGILGLATVNTVPLAAADSGAFAAAFTAVLVVVAVAVLGIFSVRSKQKLYEKAIETGNMEVIYQFDRRRAFAHLWRAIIAFSLGVASAVIFAATMQLAALRVTKEATALPNPGALYFGIVLFALGIGEFIYFLIFRHSITVQEESRMDPARLEASRKVRLYSNLQTGVAAAFVGLGLIVVGIVMGGAAVKILAGVGLLVVFIGAALILYFLFRKKFLDKMGKEESK